MLSIHVHWPSIRPVLGKVSRWRSVVTARITVVVTIAVRRAVMRIATSAHPVRWAVMRIAITSIAVLATMSWATRRPISAVILGHNHPSGVSEPSEADRTITVKLAKALALVEVRLLDHVVVSRGGHVSLAERGLV